MREIKTTEQLKREYWSRPEQYFTPHMIDALVEKYDDKPATSGEAFFVLRERIFDLLSQLPLFGRLIK